MMEHEHQVVGIAIAMTALANGANPAIVPFQGSVG
jgi:hypothetical protein